MYQNDHRYSIVAHTVNSHVELDRFVGRSINQARKRFNTHCLSIYERVVLIENGKEVHGWFPGSPLVETWDD